MRKTTRQTALKVCTLQTWHWTVHRTFTFFHTITPTLSWNVQDSLLHHATVQPETTIWSVNDMPTCLGTSFPVLSGEMLD